MTYHGTPKRCAHECIYFSDGGKWIRCMGCPAKWMSPSYDGVMLGINDFRVKLPDTQ